MSKSHDSNLPTLMTTKEVSARVQVSGDTLRRMVKQSRIWGLSLPCVRVGRSLRWTPDAVLPWMKEYEAWQASESGEAAIRSGGGR